MTLCKHHEICGRHADKDSGDGLCILHSRNPVKNKEAFDKALAEHRDPQGPHKTNKDNFSFFVFPGDANFRNVAFPEGAMFRRTIFCGKAHFRYANFQKATDFVGAELHDYSDFGSVVFADADFSFARLEGRAYFNSAKFGDQDNPGNAKFATTRFVRETVFRNAQFHGRADFGSAVFEDEVDFGNAATFYGVASFKRTKFSKDAFFHKAGFDREAHFVETDFHAQAYFDGVDFFLHSNPIFNKVTFEGEASFFEANFSCPVSFDGSRFCSGANFASVEFLDKTSFQGARFHGRTLFLPRKEDGKIQQVFSGVEVDFRWVTLEPPDVLVMRDADLSKCQFLGTDLRKAEITGAKWADMGDRIGVHDERCSIPMDATREWAHIERLYRELKQNYEDRRDYERSRYFHYGEKEMRRINPDTPCWYRWFLLTPYWLISGYGERCLRPLAWAVGVLTVSMVAYICGDMLAPGKQTAWAGDPRNLWDVMLYSLRVMLLLKPDDFVCIGLWGKFINTAQSIVGPLLIGLFGLAVRQRLKR